MGRQLFPGPEPCRVWEEIARRLLAQDFARALPCVANDRLRAEASSIWIGRAGFKLNGTALVDTLLSTDSYLIHLVNPRRPRHRIPIRQTSFAS